MATTKTDSSNVSDYKRYISGQNSTATDDDSLSSALPRPNIVRIEVLDGGARDRYLNSYVSNGITGSDTIYSVVNKARKTTVKSIFTGTRKEEKVFYGFLDAKIDPSFDMTASWKKTSIGSNISGAIKFMGNNSGVVGNLANGLISFGESATSIASTLTQMNTTATGASTMKEFDSIGLSDFTINCIWYLPEQEKLATHSLQILYRMMYPRQISNDAISEIVSAAAKTTLNTATTYAENTISTIENKISGSTNISTQSSPNTDESTGSSTVSKLINLASSASGGGASVTNKIGSFFGYNTTVNPLPVRVCVGQYMDIEPLVITGIKTNFSHETFINSDGRHLPIYAKTAITFQYWLNPSPNLEFVNLLGTEIFGDSSIVQSSGSNS